MTHHAQNPLPRWQCAAVLAVLIALAFPSQ